MSARKIKHWGENSEAAFGKSGKKGDDGEYWFADYYQTLGFIAEVHKGSNFQNKGIDVTLTDKDGKVHPDESPVKMWDHGCDAMRYAIFTKLNKPRFEVLAW